MDLKVLTLLLMTLFISIEACRDKTHLDRLEALTIENQQLKYSNINIKRHQHLPHSGVVDYEAVSKASYLTCAPMAYLAGVRGFEAGFIGLECGNIGKSKYAVEHGTPQQTNYIDSARTLTKYAWDYCGQSPDCQKYLARKYTGATYKDWMNWYRGVRILERRETIKLTKGAK